MCIRDRACRAYATSKTSVCPSITLVDCDHMVQQNVEIGTCQAISASPKLLVTLYSNLICRPKELAVSGQGNSVMMPYFCNRQTDRQIDR